MGETGRAIVAMVASIIGLAIVATILSTRAQTPQVIGSAGNALASVIGAATAPVTGGGGGFGGSLLGGGGSFAPMGLDPTSLLSGIGGMGGLGGLGGFGLGTGLA